MSEERPSRYLIKITVSLGGFSEDQEICQRRLSDLKTLLTGVRGYVEWWPAYEPFPLNWGWFAEIEVLAPTMYGAICDGMAIVLGRAVQVGLTTAPIETVAGFLRP